MKDIEAQIKALQTIKRFEKSLQDMTDSQRAVALPAIVDMCRRYVLPDPKTLLEKVTVATTNYKGELPQDVSNKRPSGSEEVQ